MNPLSSLFSRSGSGAPTDLKSATQAWMRLPELDLSQAHYGIRYVAVGMVGGDITDINRSVTKLAALGIGADGISASDSLLLDFAVEESAREQALRDFMEFVGNGILVSYRADFGLQSLRKRFADANGGEISPRWLDLALLLPEIFPEGLGKCITLADWLHFFDLDDEPTDALSDALAASRLFLSVLARAGERGFSSPADLMKVEKARRWLWSH